MTEEVKDTLKKYTENRVNNLVSFLEKLKELKQENVYTTYRGHPNNRWPLQAPIHRTKTGAERYEHDITRDLIALHPDEFNSDNTMFDKLVRMQHYGLPTRLLDLTSNPLVALYFACQSHKVKTNNIIKETDGSVLMLPAAADRVKYYDSDTVSILSNLANLRFEELNELSNIDINDTVTLKKCSPMARLINFVKFEKSHFKNTVKPRDLYRPIFVKPKNNNRRILSQSGSFIIFGLTKYKGGQSTKHIYDRDTKPILINIPHIHKVEILKELKELGIHNSSLFPELDKAAQSISEHYRTINLI